MPVLYPAGLGGVPHRFGFEDARPCYGTASLMSLAVLPDITEAAIVDLCLSPFPTSDDWSTLKGAAKDIGAHARVEFPKSEVDSLLRRLVKAKLVSSRASGYETTDVGLRALLVFAHLEPRMHGHASCRKIPVGLIGDLGGWLDSALGARIEEFLRASQVPFKMPRRQGGAYDLRSLLRNWNDLERGWKVLALVQQACAVQWWAGRNGERAHAIFEVNQILVLAGVLARWADGTIHDVHDNAVRDEHLALQRATAPSGTPLAAITSRITLPDPSEIDWNATEAELQDKLVVPLLLARQLRNVSVRAGPREYGKDIVGWYEPPFSYPRWVAVQVKRSLSGVAAKHEMRTLQEQIEEAFRIKVQDPRSKAEHLIGEVWVVVLSTLSPKVRDRIVGEQRDPAWKANVRFFDKEALIDLLVSALGPDA